MRLEPPSPEINNEGTEGVISQDMSTSVTVLQEQPIEQIFNTATKI